MNTNSRVVWHVFGTMDIGGAELRTLDLAEALAPRGVNFEYVTLSGRAGVLDERIAAAGGAVHSIPLGLTWPIRFFWALRRRRPEVVDSHVATFSGLVVFIAALAKVPVRISHFRSDGDGRPDTILRRMQRAVMKFLVRSCSTHVLGVSPSSLSSGYGAGWEKAPNVEVVPNGIPDWNSSGSQIDLRSELGVAGDAPLVVHVGRPSPEKNRPLAIRAVRALREDGPEAQLVLVGGAGKDAPAVESAIAEWGAGWVHQIGARPNARGLMRQADVLILTSVREGLPGVVLEALSVGTPVVSSDLPGSRFIADFVPGVWIVEGDEDAGWAKALHAAILDSRSRDEIASGFRAGPFSMEQAVLAHERIYGAFRDGGKIS